MFPLPGTLLSTVPHPSNHCFGFRVTSWQLLLCSMVHFPFALTPTVVSLLLSPCQGGRRGAMLFAACPSGSSHGSLSLMGQRVTMLAKQERSWSQVAQGNTFRLALLGTEIQPRMSVYIVGRTSTVFSLWRNGVENGMPEPQHWVSCRRVPTVSLAPISKTWCGLVCLKIKPSLGLISVLNFGKCGVHLEQVGLSRAFFLTQSDLSQSWDKQTFGWMTAT